MKKCTKNLFAPKLIRLKAALIALICAAVLLLTSALKAQTYAFTNFAGMPGGVGNVDGIGGAARFNQPVAVAVDSAGNVYVADTFNSTIRKITPDGEVTTLAGSAGQSGSGDGIGSAARFNWPDGVSSPIRHERGQPDNFQWLFPDAADVDFRYKRSRGSIAQSSILDADSNQRPAVNRPGLVNSPRPKPKPILPRAVDPVARESGN